MLIPFINGGTGCGILQKLNAILSSVIILVKDRHQLRENSPRKQWEKNVVLGFGRAVKQENFHVGYIFFTLTFASNCSCSLRGYCLYIMYIMPRLGEF